MKRTKLRGVIKTAHLPAQGFKAEKQEGGERVVSGYFTTADPDRTGDIALPTAFTKTMKQFMKNPVLCYMHDWKKPVGTILDYKITDRGVWVKAKIAEGIEWIENELWPAVEQGLIKAFSFGYRTLSEEPVRQDGKMFNQLKEVEVLEISLVTVPMNAEALFQLGAGGIKSISIGKTLDADLPEEVETYLTEVRFNSEMAPEEVQSKIAAMGLNNSHGTFFPGSEDTEHVFRMKSPFTQANLPFIMKGADAGVTYSFSTDPKDFSEDKGAVQDALTEQITSIDESLDNLWGITCQKLMAVNPDASDAQKQCNLLLDEFATMGKKRAVMWVSKMRQMYAEWGIEFDSLHEGEARVKVGRMLSKRNESLITDCAGKAKEVADDLQSLVDAMMSDDEGKDAGEAEDKGAVQTKDGEQEGGETPEEKPAASAPEEKTEEGDQPSPEGTPEELDGPSENEEDLGKALRNLSDDISALARRIAA